MKTADKKVTNGIKGVAHMFQRRETVREQFSVPAIFLVLAWLAATFLGLVIAEFGPMYGAAISGAFTIVAIILLLRLDELAVALIVAVHILVDSYLEFDVYQVALLMALALLLVCYFARSANRPWTGPRMFWLWISFLILNIYPTLNGGAFKLTNAIAFYLNLVLSAFIMFWLGNIIAKDISAVRRVFQVLSVLATFIAIHTIIQATTGIFLFETAHAETLLNYYANFQAEGAEYVSRFGSFLINPDGNGIFLATSFFLPVGLFIESKQLWGKVIYLLEMLLILVALMFTYSTGSLIAVLIGIAVFMILAGRILYTVLLPMVTVILIMIALIVFPSQISAQLAHANDQGHITDHLGTWQTAAWVTEAHPLFGVGLGDQAYLVRAEPFRAVAQTNPQAEPDNSYLQWGATAGIPVMLVFLLLLGNTFRFSWRNWKTIDVSYRPLIGGGIVALIALSINSLVVDGWTDPGGMVNLGWLIAGLVASPLIGRCLYQNSALAVDRRGEAAPVEAEIPQMDRAKRGS